MHFAREKTRENQTKYIRQKFYAYFNPFVSARFFPTILVHTLVEADCYKPIDDKT